MSRQKHSGKAVDPKASVFKKRRAAVVGRWADSSAFDLAELIERRAQMRQWRLQKAELFAAAGGCESLNRLTVDCERRCVAQCLSAIRFDEERGEILFDAAPVARLAEAINALADLRKSGPVQRLHRDILDSLPSLPDRALTIGELAPKLAARMGREDTNDFRRAVRLAVKDLGLHLKAGQRGRPKLEESSPNRS